MSLLNWNDEDCVVCVCMYCMYCMCMCGCVWVLVWVVKEEGGVNGGSGSGRRGGVKLIGCRESEKVNRCRSLYFLSLSFLSWPDPTRCTESTP